MEATIAERQRKRFKKKRATSLRRTLMDTILRTKAKADKEWDGDDNSSYASANYGLTPTVRAYLMRPPSCNNIRLKHVICFTNSPDLRYATVKDATTTYLLAMSPIAIEQRCRAWGGSKRTTQKVDHLRETLTSGRFKALKLILDIVHKRNPSPHEVASTSVKDLAVMGVKLMMTQQISYWIHDFIAKIMYQIQDGDPAGWSSLEILGWPYVLQLGVEFKIRDIYALACRSFIRQCKLITRQGADHKAVLSWKGSKVLLDADPCNENALANIALRLLEKRQAIINEILLLLAEAEVKFMFYSSVEESEAVTRKLIDFRVAFGDSRIATDLTRDGWTDAYTDGSIEGIINWIKGTGDDKNPNASERVRETLEQLAVDADNMLFARLDEMKLQQDF